MTETEKEKLDMIEILEEGCCVHVKKTIDLSKKKCTDVKSNKRVFMPDARPAREEAIVMKRSVEPLQPSIIVRVKLGPHRAMPPHW